ncbi:MAG: polysaccharide biosynthesis tyrosine autokinase, partial [Candidatus Nanopelagicales bacterium]
IVACSVLLAVGAAYLVSLLQEPMYAAETRLVLTATGNSATVTSEQTGTEAQRVASTAIATEVSDQLNLGETPEGVLKTVTVTADPNGAAILTITVTRGDPYQAAQVATAFAQGYMDAHEPPAPIASVSIVATAPTEPTTPKPLRNVLLAGIVGLLLGIGLAFLRDHFDDKVRDESGLPDVLDTIPVLGRIPLTKVRDQLVTLSAPHSSASEAYRGTRTSLRSLFEDANGRHTPLHSGGRILLVSSAGSSEGKSTTAANLAVVSARAGQRVVVVDADLRRPRLADLFGISQVPGLSDLLVSDVPTERCLSEVVDVSNLRVLPAGAARPDPAELLATARMRAVLLDLADIADLVIVDSPSILGVADSLELVPLVDLTVLVVKAGTSRRRVLTDAVERVHRLSGTLPDIVLNGVNQRRAAGRRSGYDISRA